MAVLAADHQFDDLGVGLGAGLEGADVAAVAEHRAFIRELGDLGHAVRDIEEGKAFLAQPLQDGEYLADVRRSECRGRLVENENAGIAHQRLGDLDQLPARERQVLDRRERVDVLAAGAGQGFLGDAALGPTVDQAEAPGRVADADVVGHREIGHQREFLEDADDAGGICGRRTGEGDGTAIEGHAALVGPHHAGHDLHQRRLAGAILAEHAMNAAGFDGEIGTGQRIDAAIALGNAFHAEEGACGGTVHDVFLRCR